MVICGVCRLQGGSGKACETGIQEQSEDKTLVEDQMLRRCNNGHLTGFRHCGTCGSDTGPYDWLNAVLAPAPPREIKTRRPRKGTGSIAVPGWSMFREWRERVKVKRAMREPVAAVRF